ISARIRQYQAPSHDTFFLDLQHHHVVALPIGSGMSSRLKTATCRRTGRQVQVRRQQTRTPARRLQARSYTDVPSFHRIRNSPGIRLAFDPRRLAPGRVRTCAAMAHQLDSRSSGRPGAFCAGGSATPNQGLTMKLLMLDNYDSFTYNLVQYFGELGEEVTVLRNDQTTVQEIAQMGPDRICVSPGPCSPA